MKSNQFSTIKPDATTDLNREAESDMTAMNTQNENEPQFAPSPYVIDSGGYTEGPNWSVDSNAYNRIGSVTVSDTWSAGLLASGKNLKIRKVYTQPRTAASSTGYNASVVYYDGLGNVQQSVEVKASPNGKDVVTPAEQVALPVGEMRSYLPYPANTGANGSFRTNAIADQNAYYASKFSLSDPKSYVRQQLEVSPRGILTEKTLPGFGSETSTRFDRKLCMVQDAVMQLSVGVNGGFRVAESYYGSTLGTVEKSSVQDEDGRITEVFTNAIGNTILTRRREAGNAASLADTYYVYDKHDRLAYVITPEGALGLTLGASYLEGSSVISSYCYVYCYDHKGRAVEKKIPGKGWEYFVYDKNNRIMLMQDANMRSQMEEHYWIRHEYDIHGRILKQTMNQIAATCTRSTCQQLADAGTPITMRETAILAEYKYDSLYEYEKKQIAVRQDKWLMVFNINKEAKWNSTPNIDPKEVFLNKDKQMKPEYLIGVYATADGTQYLLYYVPADYYEIATYLTATYTTCVFTTYKPQTVLRLYVESIVKADFTFSVVSGVSIASDNSNRTRGLKTYEKIAVLGDGMQTVAGKYVIRYFYYDRYGRVIQIVERNYTGGVSRYSLKYDFKGNVLVNVEQHQSSPTSAIDTKRTDYTYDSRGRLLSETTTLNGVSGSTTYTCDELGRRTNQSAGGTNNSSLSTSYSYDIRGRMTSLGENGLYGQNMTYTSSGTISGIRSEVPFLDIRYIDHTYEYDGLNRLKQVMRTSSSRQDDTYHMEYDRNGNMLLMVKENTDITKNLLQEYTYSGNILRSMKRTLNGPALPEDNVGTFYYNYDSNGNMWFSSEKDLDFYYNYLNLTSAIVGATGAYYYTWLADGTKVESSDEQSGKKLIYLGSLRYDSSTGEKSTGFAGGTLIVSSVPADSKALLYVKDHLGSVRVIVDKGGRPAVFNEYEPFGLLDKDYSVSTFAGVDFPDADNCWLYNGKEQDVLASSGLLDYGARLYDPALARWISVDPLAELFANESPYIYCSNDPINYTDPTGMAVEDDGFNGYFWGWMGGAYYRGNDAFIPGVTVYGQEPLGPIDFSHKEGFDPRKYANNRVIYSVCKGYIAGGGRPGSPGQEKEEEKESLFDLFRNNPRLISAIVDCAGTVVDGISAVELLTKLNDSDVATILARNPSLANIIKNAGTAGNVITLLLGVNALSNYRTMNAWEITGGVLGLLSVTHYSVAIIAGAYGIWFDVTTYLANGVVEFNHRARSAFEDFLINSNSGNV